MLEEIDQLRLRIVGYELVRKEAQRVLDTCRSVRSEQGQQALDRLAGAIGAMEMIDSDDPAVRGWMAGRPDAGAETDVAAAR